LAFLIVGRRSKAIVYAGVRCEGYVQCDMFRPTLTAVTLGWRLRKRTFGLWGINS